MKFRLLVAVAILAALSLTAAYLAAVEQPPEESRRGWDEQLRKTIERYLGYPYSLGHSGPKRFDCSGFVWRVMTENGIRVKRTSARKLFLLLPRANEQEHWQLGAVVFFDRLRHCGLVENSSLFYHASSKRGTTRSTFDPYWRSRISGFRKMPQKHAGEPTVNQSLL
ncbi:MAG TPA: NlpC/P60 family protein [Syntrophobacteraceae bacterium]|jgi:cell wall-associated NlpC family hydrolase|nr:NlpC/P60 family protein [Syntrophobacteraceae bacterium]